MSELKVEIENGGTFSLEEMTSSSAKINGENSNWDLVELKEGKFHIVKDNKSYVAEVVNADHSTKTFQLKKRVTLMPLAQSVLKLPKKRKQQVWRKWRSIVQALNTTVE